jgi:hypothetical protein
MHAGQLRLQTHSEYVITIAFPQQQWLRERALISRYTYSAYVFSVMVIVLSSYFFSEAKSLLPLVGGM